MSPFQDNKDEERAQPHSEEEEEEEKKRGAVTKKTWHDWVKAMKVFLWNPDTRQFMGRTAKSWGKSSVACLSLVGVGWVGGVAVLTCGPSG